MAKVWTVMMSSFAKTTFQQLNFVGNSIGFFNFVVINTIRNLLVMGPIVVTIGNGSTMVVGMMGDWRIIVRFEFVCWHGFFMLNTGYLFSEGIFLVRSMGITSYPLPSSCLHPWKHCTNWPNSNYTFQFRILFTFLGVGGIEELIFLGFLRKNVPFPGVPGVLGHHIFINLCMCR